MRYQGFGSLDGCFAKSLANGHGLSGCERFGRLHVGPADGPFGLGIGAECILGPGHAALNRRLCIGHDAVELRGGSAAGGVVSVRADLGAADG